MASQDNTILLQRIAATALACDFSLSSKAHHPGVVAMAHASALGALMAMIVQQHVPHGKRKQKMAEMADAFFADLVLQCEATAKRLGLE